MVFQVQDGYRDLKLFVRFVNSQGLCIIGEIQFHDRVLHDLKMQVVPTNQICRLYHPE